MNSVLGIIMSPNLSGGHTDFGEDPVGIGVWGWHDTFLFAQYLVNQWLDSYQIFKDI